MLILKDGAFRTLELSSLHGNQSRLLPKQSGLYHRYSQACLSVSSFFTFCRVLVLTTTSQRRVSTRTGRPTLPRRQIRSLLTGIFLLAFWLPIELNTASTHTQVLAFSAVYGFMSGAWISLILPCCADLGNVETVGQRFGVY